MQRNVGNIPEGFGQIGSLALNKTVTSLEPSDPVIVSECDNLRQAIEVMKSFRIGCAVVVDLEGKISGILSERDILLKWALEEKSAEEMAISEVMTSNPKVINSEDTIAAALYCMSNGGFRHLPIVDQEGRPSGVISVKDIMDFISIEFMRNLVGPASK